MKMYKKKFCTKILLSNEIYKRKIFVPKAYSLNKLTRSNVYVSCQFNDTFIVEVYVTFSHFPLSFCGCCLFFFTMP